MPNPPTAAPATDLFLALTPDRVLEAVEAGGFATRPVCYPLNSFENRVYEVELEDESRVIAKFYRPGRWSAEQIAEEHRFLAELIAEEMPVAPMLAFPDGSTLKSIEGIYYCLAPRRGGRAPDELTDDLAQRLGMLVGRLHNVAARGEAPSRPPLTADTYVRQNLAWLAEHQCLPPHLERRYLAAGEEIAEITDRLMEGVAVQRIHADLHLGNLLDRDGRLRLLDFDDMTMGPAVQDVWLALPGRGGEADRLRALFLAGYEQFRLFDDATLRLVEPLRALRMVRYAAWLARRWHDPIFKATWADFGTEEYWLRETEDLEEQLAVIRTESGPKKVAATPVAASGDDPELLTNKDYFWDWEGD